MNTLEKVVLELKRLGLMPEQDDNHVVFKYQMVGYVYIQDPTDEQYFSLNIPFVMDVTEENEYEVLKVMNECNNLMKAVKLVNNDGQVWISLEQRLQEDAELEDMVKFGVIGLYAARDRFENSMKGLC